MGFDHHFHDAGQERLSGIVATSRLLGQAIGAAIVALCLSLDPTQGAILALWVGCGAAALGSLVSFLRLLPSVRGGA